MKKHLNAKGKGEYKYGFKHDMLIFRIKDQDYDRSIDFDNIIIDLNKDDFIIGIRIFDASKVFDLPKSAFKNILGFNLNARVEDKEIHIQLKFKYKMRNKEISMQGQDFIRETIGEVNDSQVSFSAA